jgi:antitoxin StbD
MVMIQRVEPTSVARSQLSTALKRFRRDGVHAEPLVFGSHRRAEGVVLPWALYEAVLPAIEDAQIAPVLRERIADGRDRVSLEHVIDELGFDRDEFDL